jgi:hypothetical protein
MSDALIALLDEWITEKQLAQESGKSERFWKRQRAAARAPPWRTLGRTIIYHRARAIEWLNAGLIYPARPRPGKHK